MNQQEPTQLSSAPEIVRSTLSEYYKASLPGWLRKKAAFDDKLAAGRLAEGGRVTAGEGGGE